MSMKPRATTLVLAILTLTVLVLSIPGSLRDSFDRGGIYLFSSAFLEDMPKRLAGPGRFRFIMQPTMAIILGVLNGRADFRAGTPPYLYAVLLHRELRGDLIRSAYLSLANLVMMGVLLDAVFQRILFGVIHPIAALVFGPVLICFPYVIARALSNRLARRLGATRP